MEERFTESQRKHLRGMINAWNEGRRDTIDFRSFIYYTDILLSQKEGAAKNRKSRAKSDRSDNNAG